MSETLENAEKRRRPRKSPPLRPAPQWSAHVYVRLPQTETRLFRYLLEGYDNLAFTSVIERKTTVLKVVYSPSQEREVLAVLQGIAEQVRMDIFKAPGVRVKSA